MKTTKTTVDTNQNLGTECNTRMLADAKIRDKYIYVKYLSRNSLNLIISSKFNFFRYEFKAV